jgi:hypothetical protein
MKLRLILAMTAAILLGFGLSSAQASGGLAGSGDPFTLTFDEFGNGVIDLRDGTGPHSLPGSLLPDPSGGASVPVLTFMLPSLVTTGDVRIWETTLGSGPLSDVLRFTDANGTLNGGLTGTRMIVYSDIETGEAQLADTGIPVTLVPRDAGGLLEIGPEGNNGVTFFPGSATDNIYVFTSDGSIPEPSSIITLSLGALGFAGYVVRHRHHRAVAA